MNTKSKTVGGFHGKVLSENRTLEKEGGRTKFAGTNPIAAGSA